MNTADDEDDDDEDDKKTPSTLGKRGRTGSVKTGRVTKKKATPSSKARYALGEDDENNNDEVNTIPMLRVDST